jgi:Ca2+-binding RTX toxin-like protein
VAAVGVGVRAALIAGEYVEGATVGLVLGAFLGGPLGALIGQGFGGPLAAGLSLDDIEAQVQDVERFIRDLLGKQNTTGIVHPNQEGHRQVSEAHFEKIHEDGADPAYFSDPFTVAIAADGNRTITPNAADNSAHVMHVRQKSVANTSFTEVWVNNELFDAWPTASLSVLTIDAAGATVNVEDVPLGVTVNVDDGGSINVGKNGLMASVRGELDLEGASLTVDDSDDASARTVTITDQGMGGFSDGKIKYSIQTTLTVLGGRGGDTFHVDTIPDAQVTLFAGRGNDVINVGKAAAANAYGQFRTQGRRGVFDHATAELTVEGQEGNDTFNIETLTHAPKDPNDLKAWAPITVVTSAPASLSTETNLVKIAAQAQSLDGIKGTVTVDAGKTIDSIYVCDLANAQPDEFIVKIDELTRDFFGRLIFDGDLENLTLDAGTGNNQIKVRAQAGNLVTTINAGAGNDTVTVGSATATLNDIAGTLTVDGQGGTTDKLVLDDSGDATANTGSLTGTTVTGLGMSKPLSFKNVENLEARLGTGNDTFTVVGTQKGVATLITTGAGSDTVIVGSTNGSKGKVDGFHSVGVDGGSNPAGAKGGDRLIVDDSGDTSSNTGSADKTVVKDVFQITGLDMDAAAVIGFTNVEAVTVRCGSGNDKFTNRVGALVGFDGGLGQNGVGFEGTPRNDVIRIAWGDDFERELVFSINGATEFYHVLGCDTIIVHGGKGNDKITMTKSGGRHWKAEFYGEAGNDRLVGSLMNDRLVGGPGNDILNGGPGKDRLLGGPGRNTLLDTPDRRLAMARSAVLSDDDILDIVFGGARRNAKRRAR